MELFEKQQPCFHKYFKIDWWIIDLDFKRKETTLSSLYSTITQLHCAILLQEYQKLNTETMLQGNLSEIPFFIALRNYNSYTYF